MSLNATRRERFFDTITKARARRSVAIMGVVNVTPDSFSDGGKYLSLDAAKARVDEVIREGANIVDIGGESTRPNAKPISAKEQLERVLEIVKYASKQACVSIDTTSATVAHACLDAGAVAINDVSNLRDESLADVAFGAGAALILSHARAPQEDMPGFGAVPENAYVDVVRDVLADFFAARNKAVARGVPESALVMDPGLGFSKSSRHSMTLLRKTRELVTACGASGIGVLIGASRKSLLTLVDPDATPAERIGASVAAAIFAANQGASILRVHDVRATRQALDLSIVLTTRGHGNPTDTDLKTQRGDHQDAPETLVGDEADVRGRG